MDDQQPEPKDGDNIQVGNIENSNVVAVGAGATAVYNAGLTTEAVAALVVELKRVDQPEVWDGRFPYLGLTAFQESDAQFFFGREGLVDELLERVQAARFIVIAGPSGSGKSSVARAGLFHALREGRLDKSDSWLLATMQPKGDPIEQLALAMARLAKSPGAGDHLRQQGRENQLALHEQVETLLSDDGRQHGILLVDQFEETFTQTKEEDRAPFIDLLTRAAGVENGRLTVILSLRADFVSHCARYPDLRALMSQQFQLVGAMDPPDLAKAITLPALEVGAEIDPALVSRIMADMKGEPGALPLMSFALRDLFEAEKSAKGKPMDLMLPEYLQRGGVEKALERHANKVFDTFTDEQKGLARGVFSKLIEVGQGRADTRRTAIFSELVPAGVDEGEVATVVHMLAKEDMRLITTSGDTTADGNGDERTVTLAHEKLIDAWPWLRQLVDENREIIALQNQIQNDAKSWDEKKDVGFLYHGGRLIQVEEKLTALAPTLNELSQMFIQTSLQAEKQRQRNRRFIQVGSTVALIIVLLLSIGSFLISGERNDAVAARNEAEMAEETAVAAKATSDVNAELAANAKSTSDVNAELANVESLRAIDAQETAIAAKATSDANADLAATSAAEAIHARATSDANAALASTREAEAVAAESEAALARDQAEQQQQIMSLIAQSQAVMDQPIPPNEDIIKARLMAVTASQIDTEGTNRVFINTWQERLARNWPNHNTLLTTLTEHTHGANVRAYSVAWNNDGTRLASGLSNNNIVVWNTITWHPIITLTNHTDSVTTIAWSEDGTHLASDSNDDNIIIWDAINWQPIITLTEHTDDIKSLAWNIDGIQLASSSNDNSIIIWDTTSWQPKITLTNHTDNVNSVAWNEDGTRLASASKDGSIIIWNTITWQPTITLTNHTAAVNGVAWNKDGTRLVSNSSAKIIIWDTAIWQPITTLDDLPGVIWSVTWNEDGTQLASGLASSIIIWDTATWQPISSIDTSTVFSMDWNNDGTRLAAGIFANEIPIWNTAIWQPATTILTPESWVSDTAWNSNGTRLASSLLDTNNKNIIIWNTDIWQPVAYLTASMPQYGVTSIAWNEDGTQLASGSYQLVSIWDSNTWQPITTLTDHTDWITDLAWNNNETQLASSSEDTSIIIWDIEIWQSLTTLTNHKNGVQTISWSKDGTRLATGSCGNQEDDQCVQGEVIIWDTTSWNPTITLTQHMDNVSQVAWNKDGTRLATGSSDKSIIIWDTDTWEAITTLTDHTTMIKSMSWNDDGTHLATGSYREIIIWDATTWQQLSTVSVHTGWVESLDWNETRLASGSNDKSILIWENASEVWSGGNCELAGRNLSLIEWEQLFPDETYRCTCDQWTAGENAPMDAAMCQPN